MLDPGHLPPGQEQFEHYKSAFDRRGRTPTRVQYDYRDHDGTLFSCVDVDLEKCRARRDTWLAGRQEK